MDKPTIPAAICVGCGTALYWCGVHEDWMDRKHRKSHDEDGRRIKHTPTQPDRRNR